MSLRTFHRCRAWLARLFAAACVLAPCVAAGEEGNRAAAPQSLARVLGGLHVVEGTIVSAKRSARFSDEDGTVYDVDLEVSRVYCGEGVADHTPFTALMGEGRPYARRAGNFEIAMLDRRAGDHRIWLIGWDASEKHYTAKARVDSVQADPWNQIFVTDWDRFLPFLGTECGEAPPKLEAAPKVAAALHALSEAGDDAGRARLLREQIRGADPYVAVTDAWLLFRADGMPDRAKIAMDLFLDPKVPVVARTCLAGVVHGKDWPDAGLAPRRVGAFVEMAGASRTKADFLALAKALCRAPGFDLSIPECLDVTRAALNNSAFLAECDEHEANLLGYFVESARTGEDRDRIFDFFSARIGPGSDRRFELAAASAIRAVNLEVHLTPAQVARLPVLRAACRDPAAAYDLGLALSYKEKRQ